MKKMAAVLMAVMMMVCCVSAFAAPGAITPEEAKAIALDYAKLNADQVTFTKCRLDMDDGRTVYEIEFFFGGVEYDLDVDAQTGRVTDTDRDFPDRFDRDDDGPFDDFFDFD